MKKLSVLICLLFLLNTAWAQTTTPVPGSPDATTMPSVVTNRFSTDYPGMSPTWSMDGSNYRASYLDGTTNRSMLYDSKGNIIGREQQLTTGNYPNSIGDYYTKTYPGETYDVWSSTDASGNQTFYTNRNSERIWFDKSGQYKSKSKLKSQKK